MLYILLGLVVGIYLVFFRTNILEEHFNINGNRHTVRFKYRGLFSIGRPYTLYPFLKSSILRVRLQLSIEEFNSVYNGRPMIYSIYYNVDGEDGRSKVTNTMLNNFIESTDILDDDKWVTKVNDRNIKVEVI